VQLGGAVGRLFEGGAERRDLKISGPAQSWLVPTVRMLAADLAGRADFDVEAITDLRMAVDEACATLIHLSSPDAQLHCRFAVDVDQIDVRVHVDPRDPDARVNTAGFGWRVLRSLVDQVSTESTADGHARLGIHLVKRQPLG
jgi:serine/threonine-protein kinase RsbW